MKLRSSMEIRVLMGGIGEFSRGRMKHIIDIEDDGRNKLLLTGVQVMSWVSGF